jgi:hypothetical protein
MSRLSNIIHASFNSKIVEAEEEAPVETAPEAPIEAAPEVAKEEAHVDGTDVAD